QYWSMGPSPSLYPGL
ncbi:hypothetical protein GBAR_LOCUS12214, partial [Geodia barretti]